ncbi:cytochrome P450 2K1-like [Centroberyx affinis]|uniref:cytochrome P450 2K1-like n=1 Tax=Centroberyx affinis TaxID=166261 RepID=UPI003A5BB3CF
MDLLLQSSSSVSLLEAAVFLLVLYLFSIRFSSQEKGKEPPGPKPLPLLGNLLQLDLKRPHHTLYKGLDEEMPQKACGAPNSPSTIEEMTTERDQIQAAVSDPKQTSPVLRPLNRDGKVLDEEMPQKGCGAPNSPSTIEDIEEMMTERDQIQTSSVLCPLNRVGKVYNMFPWLGKWFGDRRQTLNVNAAHRNQMTKLIRGLEETLNPQMCRGFVDSFLVQSRESGNMNTHHHKTNLLTTVSNLFGAATDTTGATLRWGLLLMAKNPNVQDQVQEELSRVIGSRQIRVEDRKNLPYTDAVIRETQRLANVVPLSLPHKTSQDVTFQGYFIKKGTTVYPLLTSVLYDETEWESPHTFNPAHFLDKDGKFVKKDAFLPFSAGRRVCVGESLARMELFLFFTSLLQRFHFAPPPGVTEGELDLTSAVGFVLHPSPHKLCAVCRI